MTAVEAATEPWIPVDVSHRQWAELSAQAPQLAATMRRYLVQLTTFLAPRSVEVADIALRQLARWLTEHTDVTVVADITRSHFEDYKVWLAAQPGTKAPTMAKNTQRQRLRMIRIFLERLIEWDWPDAPRRNPILHGDIPPRPEPLPEVPRRPRRRPLHGRRPQPSPARATGSSSRCSPAPDYAPVSSATSPPTPSPRSATPTGCASRSANSATTATSRCTPTSSSCSPSGPPSTPTTSAPTAASSPTTAARSTDAPSTASSPGSAKRAGIGHVHPHQLRHTLATQAINRGMRLEAIAALLGHRSMEMTLTYARIADRVVADEYASVHAHIDALYGQIPTGALPADVETAAMTRLRHEAHARMLGNGLCTRPAELDCRMETVCETCAYFATGPEFVPVLLRQRDHARERRQTDRADLFDTLIQQAGTPP